MVATVAAVRDAKSAVSYMEQEGYYTDGDPEMRAASRWRGKGAERLGLTGQVDSKTMLAFLEGRVPGENRQLGRKIDGVHTHQPGIDITLSAPKSVSLAALVGGDARVLKAHREAVVHTLAYVEKAMVHTRIATAQGSSETKRVSGQEMIAATFEHDTNRNLDPQLHTHCIIANMVLGEDGKWRTMHNRNIFQDIKLAGAVYRSELAHALKDLGYQIESTAKDGRFELAGFDADTLKTFSSRRAEIVKAVEAQKRAGRFEGVSDAMLAQRAALFTRQSKGDVDREAVRENWKAADRVLDRSIDTQMRASMGDKPLAPEPNVSLLTRAIDRVRVMLGGQSQRQALPDMTGDRAVDWAVRHLAERSATFKMSDVTRLALERGQGALMVSAIESAIERQVANDDLKLFDNGTGATTRNMVAREQAILDHFEMGVGKGKAIGKVGADLVAGDMALTDGQREAVQSILESNDRAVLVQGHAGSGKTSMLVAAKQATEAHDHKLLGIAASASAANVLTREVGIESGTLQGFIARHQWVVQTGAKLGDIKTAYAKTVLVVDEASFVSSVQMEKLNAITDRLGFARVVLVGDRHQLDAVEAGTPFAELQQAGNDASVMDAILRQRNPELKAAVIDVIQNNPAHALERLGANVLETGNVNRLAETAAKKYLSLDAETRADTGIMAPTNKIRGEINALIRSDMSRDGLITGEGVELTHLSSKGLTVAERELVQCYNPGDVVRFTREVAGIEARAGDYMEVVSCDADTGAVLLRDKGGAERAIDPEGGIASRLDVFEPAPIEMRAGDHMRWTANDKDNELFNSRSFDVVEVDNARGEVAILTDDGRDMVLPQDAPQLQHADYAFNRTVHAFQGSTVENAIAVMESAHPALTNQKTFYVELSRAREEVFIVTDNKAVLADSLEANRGEQMTALAATDPERLAGLGAIEIREADILGHTQFEINHRDDGYASYEEWAESQSEINAHMGDADPDYDYGYPDTPPHDHDTPELELSYR